MRIAVFGAGGIGGYLGARLAQGDNEVALIARGAHLKAIQERGLFVQSPAGDFHMTPSLATEHPADVGEVDLVLLGVKAWDVRAAAECPVLAQAAHVTTAEEKIVDFLGDGESSFDGVEEGRALSHDDLDGGSEIAVGFFLGW